MFSRLLALFTLPLLLFFSNGSQLSMAQPLRESPKGETGILERLIVTNGIVTMDLDLNQLNTSGPVSKESKRETLRFEVGRGSFFTALVFNKLFRSPELGSMALVPKSLGQIPNALQSSLNRIVLEKIDWSEPYDLVVRDGKTGFVFFNIEGNLYDYDAGAHLLRIHDGRLLLSKEFADKLGHPADANAIVGRLSIVTTMSPIEITKVANGKIQSATLSSRRTQDGQAFVPGPDVIIGNLPAMQQFGASGSRIGLVVATTSCNQGDQELDWFAMPNTDHSVIPQNLYRMSGGATNDQRFEQIGQSWLKHAFYALQEDACGFGCTAAEDGTHLGVGCSDPYSVNSNGNQDTLGSRAWVNPFTGAFPSTAKNHNGHAHNGVTHRLLVEAGDLDPGLNAGATFYAEGQYVTPHEYAWCQAHPGQCNMYNNVSYRRFNVSGTGAFTFSPVGNTAVTSPAINAWTGATINQIEPDPGGDGIFFVGYKVTNPSAGVWHYEYAIYNENLDRGIQSFSVPLGCGITISDVGFHAPPNHPGIANDGTVANEGYSNASWSSSQTSAALSWSSETFAQNQNANALRWGTLYNFRFDSNHPPGAATATVGFFKTGSPMTVATQAPAPDACSPLQMTAAVSRKTHGDAGTFDIHLPLSGEPGVECRSGGPGGDHTVVFTFNNEVVSGSATVTAGTGNVSGSPTFEGSTMTLNLTGVADVQKISVTVHDLTDGFAQVLPDTTLSINMLTGDTSGDKAVNSSDIAQTKAQSGAAISAGNFLEDVTVNGSISASDIALVKAHSGNGVP